MMRLIVLSLLIFSKICFTQNLVGNPSFEDYSECPPDVGLGLVNYIHFADGWMDNFPTADFFHECGLEGGGVPSNYYGYQTPNTGLGYGGFATRNSYLSNGNEGITRQLEDTLIIDSTYYCSFKISLASNHGVGNNKIGIKFSTYLEHYDAEFGVYPDIGNFAHLYTDAIITDTINWIHVQGSFEADSAYTYIGLANYFYDDFTSISGEEPEEYIYYYIDDICVSLTPEDCSIVPCSETFTSIDTTVCFPFKLPSGNTLHSEVETYNDTLFSLLGCDSIISFEFTSRATHNTQDTTVCDSYLSPQGYLYTESGVYLDTLTNIVECDSIITTNLLVNYSNNIDTSANVCDEFSWYGMDYFFSDSYEHIFINEYGCDSIISLELIVNNSSILDTIITSCDSLTWNDSTHYISGVIENTYEDINGCDSTVVLNLTINESILIDTSVTICDEFTWFGATYTESGIYDQTFISTDGCDSTKQLHLIVNHSSYSDTIVEACNEFIWYGELYTESGTYERNLLDVNGCDSLILMNLTLYDSFNIDTVVTACNEFSWLGDHYYESGLFTNTLLSSNGCDSVVNLDLTIISIENGVIISDASLIALQDGVSYQWINCIDNEIIDGANFQEYEPEENGYYAVILTSGECVDTSECMEIDYLSTLPLIDILDISLYINPDNNIEVAFGNEVHSPMSVLIFDLSGRIVYTKESFGESQLLINSQSFSDGLYFITIFSPKSDQLYKALIRL